MIKLFDKIITTSIWIFFVVWAIIAFSLIFGSMVMLVIALLAIPFVTLLKLFGI